MIVRKAKTRILPILRTVFSEIAQDAQKYDSLSEITSVEEGDAPRESSHPGQLKQSEFQQRVKIALALKSPSMKRRANTVQEPEPQNSALKFLMKQLQIAKRSNMPCSPHNLKPLRRTFQRKSISQDLILFQRGKIQKWLEKRCLCRRDTNKRIFWDIFIVLLVLWNVIIVPLELCFEVSSFHSQFYYLEIIVPNYFIDLIFLFDLVLNFRTTHLDEEGEQVTDACKIAKHYVLKGTFFVDFIAALPVESIPRISYFKLIGLLKLTRLQRLPSIITRLNFTTLSRTILRLVNLILFLIVIYHIVASFWLFIVLHENKDWIPPVNWINFKVFNYFDYRWEEQYMIALYSSQLALNSGQIGPRTNLETVAASAIIFLGMFVNALMFGTMSELLFSLRKLQRENQVLIDSANTIMDKISLPAEERRKIVTYLSSIKVTHHLQIQLSRFQNQIPPTLRFEVRKHIYTGMLHKSVLLQHVIMEDDSDHALNYLVSQFETVLSEPEDVIIKQGGESEEMYFVAQGSARVMWRDLSEQTFKKLKVLKEGAHFGEIGLIYNCKRTMSVETFKYSLFARLSRQNFNTLNFNYENIFKIGIRGYKDKYKKNIETVLERLPLFRGLSQDQINRIVFAFQNRAFPNQSYAFKENDPQEGVYIIQSGFMLLTIKAENMTVPLKSLKRGHVIGYDQIFLPSIHRVSGQCLNYTLVGTDKRRETCFKEPPQPKRRNALRTNIQIPAIKLTKADDETQPSTRRELLSKKK